MQCLCVTGTTTECPFRSVHLWEDKGSVCVWLGSPMTECPYKRVVQFWDVKDTVFVCGLDHD